MQEFRSAVGGPRPGRPCRPLLRRHRLPQSRGPRALPGARPGEGSCSVRSVRCSRTSGTPARSGPPERPISALVFRARVGDREVEGCDFIHVNDEGMIDELFVMIRPATGLMALAEAMKRQLELGTQAALHPPEGAHGGDGRYPPRSGAPAEAGAPLDQPSLLRTSGPACRPSSPTAFVALVDPLSVPLTAEVVCANVAIAWTAASLCSARPCSLMFVERVAELVVARVERRRRRCRRTARTCVGRLDVLGAGEDAAGRDAGRGERVVVRAPVERDRLVGQALAVPEVLEHLLDHARAVRAGEALLVAVAVVDEPRVVAATPACRSRASPRCPGSASSSAARRSSPSRAGPAPRR